jgi:hypothetical protein
MASKTLGKSLEDFDKLKPVMNSRYNLILAMKGIKPIAQAMSGTVYSFEFDKNYYDLANAIEKTQITDEQMQDYQNKLQASFEKARPKFTKDCHSILKAEFKTCKFDINQKDASPAQKICLMKAAEKVVPHLKDALFNSFEDEKQTLKLEGEIWEAIEKDQDQKVIDQLHKKRDLYWSHKKAYLAQLLYHGVKSNHKTFRTKLLNTVGDPNNIKDFQNFFVNKSSIIDLSLQHKDLEYFKALIKMGWLNEIEKAVLAKKTTNPDVLNILK